VEVIDGRCLVPFDYEVLYKSVKKTGKLILSSDACERGSFLNTVAAQITQIAFDELDAPPVVLGAYNWIVPPAELEDSYFPQPAWFLDAYHAQIKPLPGYNPVTDRSGSEMLVQGKYGVEE
jgi:2-oxoisovalerate dehydrogenase E1 component